MQTIQISVLELVTFVLRSGDIDTRFASQARAKDGIRAHQAIQKEYGPHDRAEVSFRDETVHEDLLFIAQGRADGILQKDGRVIVDEIKSTGRAIDELPATVSEAHWGQAKCYAHFYAKANGLAEIDVQLTYYQIETAEIRRFSNTFSAQALERFYRDALSAYMQFVRWRLQHEAARKESLQALAFPFATYRAGQKELAYAVYESVRRGHHLFAEAPTGIGKTVSTVFPMLKAMGEELLDKIFYLTARSTAKRIALKTMDTLQKRGARAIAVDITAKEKICLNDKVACNPTDCPYAKGHYDRINACLLDALQEALWLDADEIRDHADAHCVCPFELQLDLSVFCDVIIGDYNYAFNPQSYLRRFFELNIRPYGFLVDEAHNLVDRGRDMFSASLFAGAFDDAVGMLPEKKWNFIVKRLFSVMRLLDRLFEQAGEGKCFTASAPEELNMPIRRAMKELEVFLVQAHTHAHYDDILSFYFQLNAFSRMLDYYNEGYVTILNGASGEIRLYCVDTSLVLREALLRAKTAVLFSATLTPVHFYKRMLGGGEKSFVLTLPTPFDPDRFSIHIADSVSTRYRHRERSLPVVAELIHTFVSAKAGNYLVFFPSYAYLRRVEETYRKQYPAEELLVQQGGETENERRRFLDQFTRNGETTGFAVLGGVFSEGIDLIGERLIGACVVSVGLPGLSYERDLIRDYFEEKEKTGYAYAYLYPGLNKVLQAAGRVIRTEQDKGSLLLIDDRFSEEPYPSLFPPHWTRITQVKNPEELKASLQQFWHP